MVFQEYNLVERLSVIENVLSRAARLRAGLAGMAAADSPRRRRPRLRAARRRRPRRGLRARAAPTSCRAGSASASASPARSCRSPRCVLADEPTSSLDPKTSVEIMELMAGLSASTLASRSSSTSTTSTSPAASPSRIIGMTGGHVVYDGPPAGARERTTSRRSTAARTGSERRRDAGPAAAGRLPGQLARSRSPGSRSALYTVYATSILADHVGALCQGARERRALPRPHVPAQPGGGQAGADLRRHDRKHPDRRAVDRLRRAAVAAARAAWPRAISRRRGCRGRRAG